MTLSPGSDEFLAFAKRFGEVVDFSDQMRQRFRSLPRSSSSNVSVFPSLSASRSTKQTRLSSTSEKAGLAERFLPAMMRSSAILDRYRVVGAAALVRIRGRPT